MTNHMHYQNMITRTELDTVISVNTVNAARTVEMQHFSILRSVVLPDPIILF